MAIALGCGPNQGCRDKWRDVTNFDTVLERKYVFEPPALYNEQAEVETFGVRRHANPSPPKEHGFRDCLWVYIRARL